MEVDPSIWSSDRPNSKWSRPFVPTSRPVSFPSTQSSSDKTHVTVWNTWRTRRGKKTDGMFGLRRQSQTTLLLKTKNVTLDDESMTHPPYPKKTRTLSLFTWPIDRNHMLPIRIEQFPSRVKEYDAHDKGRDHILDLIWEAIRRTIFQSFIKLLSVDPLPQVRPILRPVSRTSFFWKHNLSNYVCVSSN